jgi:short subunit dehydrogenase-like uncharacterized protein
MDTRQNGRARGRDFDLVLFGATGFTGKLVAEYLAGKRPSIRWAIAGRSRDKLERVRSEIAAIDPAAGDLPILTGDALDRDAMGAIAARARVACTTVGPYARYGSPLVAACAEHGTDYCDLTGEPHWMRAMIAEHQARAAASGARIVHTCGFDSIPSDLGVFMIHDHLARQGDRLAEAHLHVVKADGGISGGSAATMLDVLGNVRDPEVRRAIRDPYSLNPEGAPRGPDRRDTHGPRRDRDTGRWTAPFFMAPVNARVVRRSNALLDFAYGRDFRYDEAVDTGDGLVGLARAAAFTAAMGAATAAGTTPIGRRLLERLLPAPGEGPNRETRERSSYRVEIHARSAAGRRLVGVIGDSLDPGYGSTAKMLAESALCLAEDALPPRGGMLTPASCMGMRLVERLRAAGLTFEVEAIPAS